MMNGSSDMSLFQNPLSDSFLLASVLKKFGEGLGLDSPLDGRCICVTSLNRMSSSSVALKITTKFTDHFPKH